MADHFERGAGGNHLAGDGAPDFAVDQYMALGIERLHGGRVVADERIDAQAGLHAPRLHRDADEKSGDPAEGRTDAKGHPGAHRELRNGCGYQGERAQSKADNTSDGQCAMAAEFGFKHEHGDAGQQQSHGGEADGEEVEREDG